MESKGCDTKRHMTRHPALDALNIHPARAEPPKGRLHPPTRPAPGYAPFSAAPFSAAAFSSAAFR